MADEMDRYEEVFLSESEEYLQSIVDGLLALETDPHDTEPVETVFRGAHSLKGMAAAMRYDRTSALTHKMESLMDTVRKGEQAADATLIDLMLEALDAVRGLISVEARGEGDLDESRIAEGLTARAERRSPPTEAPAAPEPSAPHAEGLQAGEHAYRVTVTLEEACVLKSVRAYMVLKRFNHLGSVSGTVPSAQEIEDEGFDRSFEVFVRTKQNAEQVRDAATAVSEVESAEVEELSSPEEAVLEGGSGSEAAPPEAGGTPLKAATTPETAPAGSRRATTGPTEAQTVRVSIAHLDNIVDLVGELVILRSRLESTALREERDELTGVFEELYRVTSELQHGVMQTRMVPVGQVFNRFPRMVRDLARDLDKPVGFLMDGLDIELDRTVLDEISDPLVHLLRNAVDHGIEPARERIAAGKPERGVVRLEASREREHVKVVVSDDGGGMDPERIWSKALERGLVSEEDRAAMDRRDVLLLCCEPGFSTLEQATSVSGRGVGMDVVKGKIEYLGGSLLIESESGRGSRFELSLPLTFAIIQALLVRAAGRVFAIPLSAVAEVVPPDEMTLERVDGKPVITLREECVVPVRSLAGLVGLPADGPSEAARDTADAARDTADAARDTADAARDTAPAAHQEYVLIETGDRRSALSVDELIGRQEIVIKPLARMFKHLRGLGGATVLGDGHVALILDPRSLFEMGRSAR